VPNEYGFSGQTNLPFDPLVLTFAIIPFYLLPGRCSGCTLVCILKTPRACLGSYLADRVFRRHGHPSRPGANALPAHPDFAFCVGEGSPLAASIELLLTSDDVFAAVCLAV